MRQRRWLFVLMSPLALWLSLLFLAPLATMVLFTFRAGSFSPEREVFTLENYRTFFSNPGYLRLLLTSAWVSLVASAVSIVLAYPVAYYLAFQAGVHRTTLLLFIIVPAWISFLLRVFAWKLILGSGGLINIVLMAIGVVDEPAPILLYSRAAVIVALIYSYVPFVALPIFVALQRIDRSLIEAASDLGSAGWRTFREVIFPLSMPGVVAAFFLIFIPTLGEYVTPLLLGGTEGLMFGNVIQSQFSRALNWPMGSLMSLVVLVFTLALLALFSRMVRLEDWVEG